MVGLVQASPAPTPPFIRKRPVLGHICGETDSKQGDNFRGRILLTSSEACGNIVPVHKTYERAEVVKLVDTQRSGRCARKGMGVRVPPSAYPLNQPTVPVEGILLSGKGQKSGQNTRCFCGAAAFLQRPDRTAPLLPLTNENVGASTSPL